MNCKCPFNTSCSKATKPYLVNKLDKPFSFERNYSPKEFFWGSSSSKILYVGVNPKGDYTGENDNFTKKTLLNGPGENKYFGTLKNWYPILYNDIGKEGGVAHTDLVKCASSTFPLKGMKLNDFDIVFKNCRNHLQTQIETMAKSSLDVVIVSGVHPCWHILDLFFPFAKKEKIDSRVLKTNIEGKSIYFIFFRQFMGRNDVAKIYRNNATLILDDVLSKINYSK